MNFSSLFLIALALSLDAFGVSVSIGLNKDASARLKAMVAASSGFFQFLFSLIGAYAGYLFTTYITTVPQIVGGAIIAIVGILMLKEGSSKEKKSYVLKPMMIIIVGISVSIDAMVIGFTAFNNIVSFVSIFLSTLFIGLVTLVVCIGAFYISRHLRKIDLIARYADYIGGAILIAFGIKMVMG